MKKLALALLAFLLPTAANAVCVTPLTGLDAAGTTRQILTVLDGSSNCIGTTVIVDGTAGANKTAVKAASTAAVATDPALVVAISPNNTVAATQSGTWNIGTVTTLGTITNPVGATLAVGAGTDGWNVTEGAKADAACGTDNGTCSQIALIKRTNQNLTTLDTDVKAPIAPATTTTGALTDVVCGSAVSSCVLKASAGNLYGVYADCTSACWLMIFNATSLPGNGATTAGKASGNLVDCIDIGAGSHGGLNYPTFPINLTVGITAAISSTACATLTASTVGFVHGTVQ